MARVGRPRLEKPNKSALKANSLAAMGVLTKSPATADGDPATLVHSTVNTLFRTDESARAAITANLRERTATSQAFSERAKAAFVDFKPTRHSTAQQASRNHLAPGEDLAHSLKSVITRGVDKMRASTETRSLRLHLNDKLQGLIKNAKGRGNALVGAMQLEELVKYVARKPGALPSLPNSPAFISCRAEEDAEKRLKAIEESVAKKKTGTATGAEDIDAETKTTAKSSHAGHLNTATFVRDEVNLQMDTATSPESELRYRVTPHGDQNTQSSNIQTFELRAGPSDVTSYHDFNSLQIAFEHVWTTVFDHQLTSLGQELYHEYVKLKEFVGDPAKDRTVNTIDDLRRLMNEVRDLARFTDFVPSELAPSNPVVAGDDVGKALADKARVGAGIATGGVSELVNALARLARGKASLTWSSFPGPLADGDVITVTTKANIASPGKVRLVLETPPDVFWWKAIQFVQIDPADGKVSYSEEIYTQDQIKTGKTGELGLEQLRTGSLEFKKGATLGFHTGFYVMEAAELEKIKDRSEVTFKWVKD